MSANRRRKKRIARKEKENAKKKANMEKEILISIAAKAKDLDKFLEEDLLTDALYEEYPVFLAVKYLIKKGFAPIPRGLSIEPTGCTYSMEKEGIIVYFYINYSGKYKEFVLYGDQGNKFVMEGRKSARDDSRVKAVS
jgi:hypothetical protein